MVKKVRVAEDKPEAGEVALAVKSVRMAEDEEEEPQQRNVMVIDLTGEDVERTEGAGGDDDDDEHRDDVAVELSLSALKRQIATKAGDESVSDWMIEHFYPGLRRWEKGDTKRVGPFDESDPVSCFKVIDPSETSSEKQYSTGPQQLRRDQAKAKKRLADIMHGRHTQALDRSTMIGIAARKTVIEDHEQLSDRIAEADDLKAHILNNIPFNTKGVLGRDKFQLSDLEDMVMLNNVHLKKRAMIYIAFILRRDANGELYVYKAYSESMGNLGKCSV